MRLVAFLRSLASGLLHRSQMEGEMDEDLAQYVAMLQVEAEEGEEGSSEQ